MSGGFNHVQTWNTHGSRPALSHETLAELASKWLSSEGTQTEKSAVISFPLGDYEVTAARRVVVTSLGAIRVSECISEVVFVTTLEACTLSMSSRSLHLPGSTAQAVPVLDRHDSDFFSSVHRHASGHAGIETEQASASEMLGALESLDRQVWLIAIGPGAELDHEGEALKALKTGLGVLADVATVDEVVWEPLNDELGLTFSIPFSGFRIFSPGFNLENALDAKRNPAIARIPLIEDSKLIDLQDASFRAVVATCSKVSPLPNSEIIDPALQEELIRRFSTEEVRKIQQANAVLFEQPIVDESAFITRINKLTEDLEFATEYAATWETQHAGIQAELNETHADLFVTNASLDDERRANAYLRRRLAELDVYDEIVIDQESVWTEVPDSFEDLVIRVAEIPFVRFTGSPDPYRQLDNQPRMEVAVSRTWEALHALSDYARLKNEELFSGGLHEYMTTGLHSGYKIGINALAMSEGEQVNVNPAFRLSRTFPVPSEVSGGSESFMEAHVKLITGSANSPRMHFLDNTGGDGLIYIGYIGRHLPSPQTN